MHEALGELDLAIEDYTSALEVDPGFTDALVARGTARSKKKDDAGAAKDLTRAIDLAPRKAAGYFKRATLRLSRGDRDGARADLERFLDLAPESHPDRETAKTLLAELKPARKL